jgi:hypothetical protein
MSNESCTYIRRKSHVRWMKSAHMLNESRMYVKQTLHRSQKEIEWTSVENQMDIDYDNR